MARKPIKQKLADIDKKAKAAIVEATKKINDRASAERAEAILFAPAGDLIELGIQNAAEHPDVKALLASKSTKPSGEAGKVGA